MQIIVKCWCRLLGIYFTWIGSFHGHGSSLFEVCVGYVFYMKNSFPLSFFQQVNLVHIINDQSFEHMGPSLNAQNSLYPSTILIILLWCLKMKFLKSVLIFFAVIWKPNRTSKERGQEKWGFYNSIDFTVVGYLTPNFYWFLVMTLLYHYFRRTQNGPSRTLPNI